ncbi:MAG: hypothetical protein HPY44_02370 [Armatimonadetes bacterium]|nr:hypothetical protein [Armatimonadota bacterium]
MKSTKTVLVVILSAVLVASALLSVSETLNRKEAAAAAESAGACVLSTGGGCGGGGCGGGPENQGVCPAQSLIAAKEEAEKGSCSEACDKETCESCPYDDEACADNCDAEKCADCPHAAKSEPCDGNCADCDEGCRKETASDTKDAPKANEKTAEKPKD